MLNAFMNSSANGPSKQYSARNSLNLNWENDASFVPIFAGGATFSVCSQLAGELGLCAGAAAFWGGFGDELFGDRSVAALLLADG